jgi:hypothetical protein
MIKLALPIILAACALGAAEDAGLNHRLMPGKSLKLEVDPSRVLRKDIPEVRFYKCSFDRVLSDYPGAKIVLCTWVSCKQRSWWKERGTNAEEPISLKHYAQTRTLDAERKADGEAWFSDVPPQPSRHGTHCGRD